MRTCEGKYDFSEMIVKLATALGLNECVNQIQLPFWPHACALRIYFWLTFLYNYHALLWLISSPPFIMKKGFLPMPLILNMILYLLRFMFIQKDIHIYFDQRIPIRILTRTLIASKRPLHPLFCRLFKI